MLGSHWKNCPLVLPRAHCLPQTWETKNCTANAAHAPAPGSDLGVGTTEVHPGMTKGLIDSI